MNPRQLGRRLDLFIGRVGTSVGDVLFERGGEEEDFLLYDRHLPTQRLQRPLADILIIERDPTCAHVVEARNEVDDGRLAAAGQSQQRDQFTGSGLEIDVAEHRRARVVGEVDVIKLDVALGLSRRHRAWVVLHFRFLVEDLEDAHPGGGRSGDHHHHPTETANRHLQDREEHQEHRDLTDS